MGEGGPARAGNGAPWAGLSLLGSSLGRLIGGVRLAGSLVAVGRGCEPDVGWKRSASSLSLLHGIPATSG